MALHTTFSAYLPHALARSRRVTFDDAVRENQDELYGVALRILGDRDAAHDATSRALLKAYRSWSSYDQTRPVRHWMLRIAANEAISIGRQRSRERERSADADDALGAPDRAPLPDERAVEREERDLVRAAVAALPELYRVPVVLRYFSDLSNDEIAAVTGRPAATIGVQLLRARAAACRAGGAPMNDRDLFDESRLRRALRFETDERIPRFDVAAIQAAAREAPSARVFAYAIAAAVVTGVLAAIVWSWLAAIAPSVGEQLLAGILDAVVTVATVLVPVADAATQPAVPMSLLAALAIAILHERRERAHVHAS